MRVLLFGATGGIGRRVRGAAHAAGHELVLFARNPSDLEPLGDGELAVAGDIGESATVIAAVEGVDAVISALGPTSNSADQVPLFEDFARTLVDAMKTHGARRLVALSGAGVTLPGERKPLRGRVASAVVRLFVRHVVRAKQRELEIIINSDLEWIAPRPPRVVEGEATGTYRVGHADSGMKITQSDLADFMVHALTDDTYLRQAPIVSN